MDVSDMIVDLAGNKMADANNKFSALMSDKINAALDAKKIELAKSFGADEEVDIEDVEVEEDEVEETGEEESADADGEDSDVLSDDEAEESEEEEVEDEDVQAVSDESS